jgi:superfamily II DNA or RNA helicase
MRVVIDNRIRISHDDVRALGEGAAREICAKFTYPNPDFHKFKALGIRGKPPPREIETWRIEKNELSLPRGGLERLNEFALFATIDDRRTLGRPELAGKLPSLKVTPWDSQVAMVQAARSGESCCLRSAAGSGKSVGALALAVSLNLPTLVVVNTTGLLKQWVDECIAKLGLRTNQIGIIRGSTRGVRAITIGMQATLRNCAQDYANDFGLVILDEAQYAAAKTFTDVIDVFTSKYRIAMSADERRADRKEFLTYDLFGPVALKVDTKALVEAGHLLDVEVVIIPTKFEAPWYAELRRRAADHRADLKSRQTAQKLMALGQNDLQEQIAADPDRNGLIKGLALGSVTNGNTVVALTHRREYAAHLASTFNQITGGRAGLLLGSAENAAEYDEAKRGMKEGRIVAAAATYQAFGTGIDVPRLDVGIFATPCANSAKGRMQFNQYKGRFARAAGPGKIPIVYYLWDERVHGVTPLKNLAAWCKSASFQRLNGERIPLKQYIRERRQPAAFFPDATTQRHADDASTSFPTTRTLRKRSEAGGSQR